MNIERDINRQDCYGETLLLHAVYLDDESYIKNLLDRGADPTIKNCYHDTVLHYAAQNGNLKLVKDFIARGVKIDSQNNCGFTPLITACRFRQFDTVKYLVKHGANVNHEGCMKRTALHWAIDTDKGCSDFKESIEITEYLLKKGADVNSKMWNGETAIFLTAWGGSREMAELLISYGAKLDIDGITPLYLARVSKNTEVAQCFIEHGLKE